MAAAWVELAEADLLSSVTAVERKAFGQSGADAEVADRVPRILADVAAEVRGYIQSADENRAGMDADASKIPPSMRARALDLARWRLLVSLPRYKPSETRRAEYDAALRYFEKVAEGKIRPEPSSSAQANPTPPKDSHAAEVVNDVPSRTGRNRMRGL